MILVFQTQVPCRPSACILTPVRAEKKWPEKIKRFLTQPEVLFTDKYKIHLLCEFKCLNSKTRQLQKLWHVPSGELKKGFPASLLKKGATEKMVPVIIRGVKVQHTLTM